MPDISNLSNVFYGDLFTISTSSDSTYSTGYYDCSSSTITTTSPPEGYYSTLSTGEIKSILDEIDISIIEQFVRDKKLKRINETKD